MKVARVFTMLLLMTLAALCLSASALAAVYLPKGTREIGDEAFMGVPLQKTFVIRSGVEKIGSCAFAGYGRGDVLAAEDAQGDCARRL